MYSAKGPKEDFSGYFGAVGMVVWWRVGVVEAVMWGYSLRVFS